MAERTIKASIAEELAEALQEVLNEASGDLYDATEERAVRAIEDFKFEQARGS